MQKSRSDNLSKFYLPSGLATNSQQLKFLQQKLLKNHFANQNYEQSQKSSKGMSNRSQSSGPQAFQKSKQISLRQYDLQAQRSSREFKEALSNDLKQQMRVKNLKKMQQKQQTISHQQTLTRHVGQLDALEKERQKKFNKKYKEEVKEDIKIQQDRRQKQIVEHQQEQVFYKNRYSGNDLIPRTQSLVQLKNSYVNPTKQYYFEVDQALRQRNIVPNPEGQASNSAFKVTRKMQQINKLDFMFAGGDLKNNYQRQRSFYQGLRTEDNRYRSQLRETLIKQIREKEELKKVEKMKDFTKPYTNPEFQQIHHPINNPVDFRIAHDNKYVLGQLRLIQ